MADHVDSGDVNEQWNRVRGRLRAEFGDAAFNSWLRPMVLSEARDGQVIMTVPTRFMRDWVVNHYADRIRELWRSEIGKLRTISIQVRTADAAKSAKIGRASCRERV